MKIDDVPTWEAFYWVAQENSFTRAANKMKIGVPLLSKKIAHLEHQLGVRLFFRSTRKVSLTHEGQNLLPQVRSVLEDLRGIENRFEEKQKIEGTLRITCLPGIAHRFLTPVLVEFHKLYPDVQFEIDLSDSIVDLIEEQFDLAIRIHKPIGADLIYKKLFSNQLVLCATPQYLKNKDSVLQTSDLKKHQVLMLEAHEQCRFLKTQEELRKFNKLRVFECKSGIFLTDLALQGAGIVVRSLWDVSPYLKDGKLVQVLKNDPLENFGDVFIVIPGRRLLAPRVRALTDFLSAQAKTWNLG